MYDSDMQADKVLKPYIEMPLLGDILYYCQTNIAIMQLKMLRMQKKNFGVKWNVLLGIYISLSWPINFGIGKPLKSQIQHIFEILLSKKLVLMKLMTHQIILYL